MTRRGLINTGPLVAFIDGNDAFHSGSVEALEHFCSPLETCDAVIAEAWFLLGRAKRGRQTLIELLSARNLIVGFSLGPEAPSVLKLMMKYADQPMSVANACLVRMAELDKNAIIVTLDSDFSVYRRGRQSLKFVAPFKKV